MLTRMAERKAQITRQTGETEITLSFAVDGTGKAEISTGIAFFDHMLTLFARHGLFDLTIRAKGDLEVDYHHTVEDVGIVLGDAIAQAVGDKKGIVRYGFWLLPMDEALARCALDLSGRAYLVYDGEVAEPWVRDFHLALLKEFFQAVTNSARMNLHLKLEYGAEPHHAAEALFKAFGRALDAATRIDERLPDAVPSTKGTLV